MKAIIDNHDHIITLSVHHGTEIGPIPAGVGLERLAMLKLGLDDIRELWEPPYVPLKAKQPER